MGKKINLKSLPLLIVVTATTYMTNDDWIHVIGICVWILFHEYELHVLVNLNLSVNNDT